MVCAGGGAGGNDGFGLGERPRDFLDDSLSLSDPNRDRVGVVGDMVVRRCGLRLRWRKKRNKSACSKAMRGGLFVIIPERWWGGRNRCK